MDTITKLIAKLDEMQLSSSLSFSLTPQVAKPTKEQTINFLKQKFTDKQFNHLWKSETTTTNWDAISFSYILRRKESCVVLVFTACIYNL